VKFVDFTRATCGKQGLVVWNIEFRRVGNGGGWPATFVDVSRAVDAITDIATLRGLDPSRTILMGFSSGGHFALWAGHQRGTPTTRAALGLSEPAVTPPLVVSLAGLSDLHEGCRLDLGPMAVTNLLGGTPTEVPERYAVASPTTPEEQRSQYLLVHGSADMTSRSR
jgi:acetyl esterase/lipase